ncbi:MAG: ABC transporter permease subunit [Phycisphaerales bacterium]|nr:ABC transporter permease subunit [Phycisphaerales bacterium]
MLSIAVRLTRYAGWFALLASSGVIVVTIVWQSIDGFGAVDMPTARLRRLFVNTIWMSACATVMALGLAIPAAFALVQARREWQRQCLLVLTIIPLMTMPSVFAYAWLLLATSSHPLIQQLTRLVGWNSPGAEPFHAAWVLATWLWPIPALIMAVSFKHIGAATYRLACVDASAVRAFFFGALPVMRAPLIAACAIVFILAAIDSTVPPLMLSFDVWAVEMVAQAGMARHDARASAHLLLMEWPMLVMLALFVLSAMPGIRQMAAWADDVGAGDTGLNPKTASWVWGVALILVAAVTVFPIVVFVTTMASGRYPPAESFQRAFDAVRSQGSSTLIVMLAAAACALAVSLTVVDGPGWPRPLRIAGVIAVGLVLTTAVLPPPLIGTALISFYADENISPSDRWNLYENTPTVWVAAMLARFVFIPVCIMRLLNRRVPQDVVDQARADGASRIQSLACARLPMLWRSWLAGAMLVACLTLSEVVASELVQPPQWGGGSLAVQVDGFMHYGRHNQTIAMGMMMMAPAVPAAVLMLSLVGLPDRRRIIRAARDKKAL